VLTLSQLNAAEEMRESRAIEHDADNVLVLEESDAMPEIDQDGRVLYLPMRLFVKKQRSAPSGRKLDVRFIPRLLRFEEGK